MTTPSLGFWFVHRAEVFRDALAERVAGLLTDRRWPWLPCLVRPTQRPGHALYPWPGGKIARGELRAQIVDVLRSELTEGANLSLSRKEAGNHAWYLVENGRAGHRHTGITHPFEALGMCRGDVPPDKNIDEWLALVRELAAALDIAHGVIWAETDERIVRGRQFVMGTFQASKPPDHPGNESARINRARQHLGERYVRLPGWATFLRSAHVEAVGGRARLLAAVQPPVVHEVGDLLYVQMSATVAEALTPEAEARRRALADLLAPITVPVVAA